MAYEMVFPANPYFVDEQGCDKVHASVSDEFE